MQPIDRPDLHDRGQVRREMPGSREIAQDHRSPRRTAPDTMRAIASRTQSCSAGQWLGRCCWDREATGPARLGPPPRPSDAPAAQHEDHAAVPPMPRHPGITQTCRPSAPASANPRHLPTGAKGGHLAAPRRQGAARALPRQRRGRPICQPRGGITSYPVASGSSSTIRSGKPGARISNPVASSSRRTMSSEFARAP